jgi:hypothetical protein
MLLRCPYINLSENYCRKGIFKHLLLAYLLNVLNHVLVEPNTSKTYGGPLVRHLGPGCTMQILRHIVSSVAVATAHRKWRHHPAPPLRPQIINLTLGAPRARRDDSISLYIHRNPRPG